jgi:hypothetical protein
MNVSDEFGGRIQFSKVASKPGGKLQQRNQFRSDTEHAKQETHTDVWLNFMNLIERIGRNLHLMTAANGPAGVREQHKYVDE